MATEDFKECTICPRNCRVNRIHSAAGYCKTGSGFPISSICIHRGEEPPVNGKNGICNIFFTGCNLHCIFCQNHDISFAGKSIPKNLVNAGWLANPLIPKPLSLKEVIRQVSFILDQGISAVGFVTPSHVVPQVKEIINELRKRSLDPVFVYNTSGYDKVETIRDLEGYIDVYLPDFKYMDASLSQRFSDASDYPAIAMAAIKEMYRQKSSSLFLNEDGRAESGLIIRHLVIPGQVENSLSVIRTIAEEISTGIAISLMSQYHPTLFVRHLKDLNRNLYPEEYQQVVDEMEKLGFRKGYFQDMESSSYYNPDFSREDPFE